MFSINCILFLSFFVESFLAFSPIIYLNKNEFKAIPDVQNHSNLHLLRSDCGPPPQQKNHAKYVTSVFDFPWMVLLKYDCDTSYETAFKCSGALINSKYVLTAAHCLVHLPNSAKLVAVRIGDHDTTKRIDCEKVLKTSSDICAPPSEDVQINKIIPHPKYGTNENKSLEYDIGLIRLSVMVTNTIIKPVCLPITNSLINMDLEGLPAIATGYDVTYKDLKKSYMPVLVNTRCDEIYENSNYQISNTQVCAGGRDGADWCIRISSGLHVPSIIGLNKRYVLFAIPSGVPSVCNMAGMPRIYTKVNYYMDWILDNLEF